MVKFLQSMDRYVSEAMRKTLILVLTVSLLGMASGEYNESCDCDIVVTANGEARVLTVTAGETVHFHGEVDNLDNVTGYRWNFDRNVVNETETELNVTDVNVTMHAVGAYNITFSIFYDENETAEMAISVFVDEAEEYDLEQERDLFSVAALLQLAVCCLLIYIVRKGKK